MSRPTQDQVDAAAALIKKHFTDYGNTATETRMQALVYSINSIMAGVGRPAREFEQTLMQQKRKQQAEIAATKTAEVEKPEKADKPPEDTITGGTPDTETPATDEGEEKTEPVTEPEDEPVEEFEEYTREELEVMELDELKALAEEGGLDVADDATKEQIIEAILAA